MLTWLDHRVSSTVFENYQKMRRLEKQQRCLLIIRRYHLFHPKLQMSNETF